MVSARDHSMSRTGGEPRGSKIQHGPELIRDTSSARFSFSCQPGPAKASVSISWKGIARRLAMARASVLLPAPVLPLTRILSMLDGLPLLALDRSVPPDRQACGPGGSRAGDRRTLAGSAVPGSSDRFPVLRIRRYGASASCSQLVTSSLALDRPFCMAASAQKTHVTLRNHQKRNV